MRISVDRMLCEANGICTELAPGLFELDDDDELQVLVTEVPTDQAGAADMAVTRCPKQALSIES